MWSAGSQQGLPHLELPAVGRGEPAAGEGSPLGRDRRVGTLRTAAAATRGPLSHSSSSSSLSGLNHGAHSPLFVARSDFCLVVVQLREQ